MDDAELELLTEALDKTIASATGSALHAALIELGWHDMLAEMPDTAILLVFRLLGTHGTHAAVLNDVLRHSLGLPLGGVVPLPYTGGSWVLWDDAAGPSTELLDSGLPLRPTATDYPLPLAAGRRALGWWLTGTSRAMLTLARTHALDRTQFGRPLASFQAVRHRLAETLVAIEGAEAALSCATDDFGALLGKAAAGQAARTAARHCQQVLGGIGFTAEHDLHRHIRRALVLDGLLGSSRELTRAAGVRLRTEKRAPRLINL